MIDVKQAKDHDLDEIREWVTGGSPYSVGGAYSPLSGVIDLNNPDNGWCAWQNGELVAFVSLVQNSSNDVMIGFIVKPTRRREGIAKIFIPLLLGKENLRSYSRIIATPRLEDIGGQKVLEHAGFHRSGFDPDGLPVYERRQ